jgi:dTMP kinase
MTGLLLVIEGIDGAGTTTQARRLCASLQARSIDCHLTREPSDGPIGKLLRQILAGEHAPTDATTLGLLFAADRADHLQREVEPALQAGKVVVSDRYYHSSLAYQGSEEDRGWIAMLNQRARIPDQTFFLEVDPEVAAKRRAEDERSDELFDRLETQKRVAEGYRVVMEELAAREAIQCIDGHLGLDEISRIILEGALLQCRN